MRKRRRLESSDSESDDLELYEEETLQDNEADSCSSESEDGSVYAAELDTIVVPSSFSTAVGQYCSAVARKTSTLGCVETLRLELGQLGCNQIVTRSDYWTSSMRVGESDLLFRRLHAGVPVVCVGRLDSQQFVVRLSSCAICNRVLPQEEDSFMFVVVGSSAWKVHCGCGFRCVLYSRVWQSIVTGARLSIPSPMVAVDGYAMVLAGRTTSSALQSHQCVLQI